MKNDFTYKVLNIVAKIPRGKIMTYTEVATKAGSPRAYRAVGSILNRNYRQRDWQLPLKTLEPIPCHRVIRSNGNIGGYARGQKEKEKILTLEGHKIKNAKIIPD